MIDNVGEQTILIVDDEARVRESVREVLSDEGYRVVDTADVTRVLDMIDEERPGLVLLDIWMPQADGIGLLKEIKNKEPEMNVVMISGHGNIHTAVTATKFGAFDFLEKPLSLEGLLLTVRRALGDSHGADRSSRERTKKSVLKKAAMAGSRAATAGRLKQKTLAQSVVTSGQGLHSGIKTGLVLHPLPANSGIQFTGISADATVRADLDNVSSTGYATSLRNRGISVATVEHFLAALHSYGITNLLVKVQSEVPILDGSAIEFCRLIEEAGITEQDEECAEIIVDQTYRSEKKDGASITIEPAEIFSVRYELRYPKPVGRQEYHYIHRGPETFKEEIAPARTFGFLRDIAQLEKMGLAAGGRLSNFILIDDEKIVNTELRFPDEFARHKILDVIGDFYLLGRPIRGAISASMTGHSDNIALLRQLKNGMSL
ncbi:MAG TPA: UDP-3-O-acyl-N-acetylglucosamine deacetylase [Candidatus Binatia bacterium]|nr:UDP-3-O-acyl-N-acetylglucosamine deacetylase [Candidatus Binatia bacterium]